MPTHRTVVPGMLVRVALAGAGLAALGACSLLLDFSASPGPSKTVTYPLDDASKLDVLLVVDTSPALPDGEIQNIGFSFDGFVAALYGSATPDLHVGVVTADLGAGGYLMNGCRTNGDGAILEAAPSGTLCAAPSGVPYLVDDATPNYSGSVGTALACILPSRQGCIYQQPLAAAARALGGAVAANAGFARPDAALAVLLITAGEDCSSTDPSLVDPTNPVPPGFRCFDDGVTCPGVTSNTSPGTYSGCTASSMPPSLTAPEALARQLQSLPGIDHARFMLVPVGASASSSVTVADSPTGQPFESTAPPCSVQTTPIVPDFRASAVAGLVGGNGYAAIDLCTGGFSAAAPALASWVRQSMSLRCMPPGVTDASRCTATLAPPGGPVQAVPPCASSADAGPAELGVRTDGSVRPAGEASLAREAGTAREAPAADAGVPTNGCFTVAAEARCASGSSFTLQLVTPPPAGTVLTMSCR